MTQEKPSRDRRAEILGIAGPLFLEHGYQGTSMSRIAAAVGGSKGTLYAYFQNKEELFEAYMQARVLSRGAAVFDLLEHPADLESTLTRLGFLYLDLITEKSSLDLLRLLYHEAPRFPEIGRIFFETCILRGRKALAAFLARADERGELRVPNPPLAAEQFLMLCQAKLVMPVMMGVITEITREEAEEVVHGAVAAFLAAYRGK